MSNFGLDKYDADLLQDMLPVYYKRLFPHKSFYKWLSYGLSEDGVFTNREFSFTLQEDIYIRNLSFNNQNELKKEICIKTPFKIDIGAVMSTRPRYSRIAANAILPVQRELVFDIDMTDYNDVRTCCSGAEVCQKCWKFIIVAVRVLDSTLREDFGFEHILWVFSGRRGVHCWVCDYEARHLNARARSALAEYMQVVTHIMVNGITIPRVQMSDRIHHSVRRALKFIEPVFEEIILDDQNLFGKSEGFKKLLTLIEDDVTRDEIDTYMQKLYNDNVHSNAIWASFLNLIHSMRCRLSNVSVLSRKLGDIVDEIQLGMLYPRLDVNVTKGFNHLLKAPFCIHPATGKVCVPFNIGAAAKFDPTAVPTISQLLLEINAFDDKSCKSKETPDDKSRIKDYKKTGMFKGVVVFEEFLRKLESSLTVKAIDISEKTLYF